MRRVRYRVAASLDGYIAGPNREVDWIVPDPDLDFASVYSGFDTVLLGRRTYELTRQPGAPPWPAGWRIYVFSRTLDPTDHTGVTVVSSDVGRMVAELRAQPGRDIWLFGGGNLSASLLAGGLVDQVEVALMPVLLGLGLPLLGAGAPRARLPYHAKPLRRRTLHRRQLTGAAAERYSLGSGHARELYRASHGSPDDATYD